MSKVRSPIDQTLSQMRNKRDTTRTRLNELRRRLQTRAESETRTERGLPSTFGRHASDWTRRHEAFFQQRLSELTTHSRNELGALEAKLKRQNAAIADHHIRISKREGGG